MIPKQEPLHRGHGEALVPVNVRMVLVQAVVEDGCFRLRGAVLLPARLGEGQLESSPTLGTRQLKRWKVGKEIERQRLDDQACVGLF